jgi:hypothetical protein
MVSRSRERQDGIGDVALSVLVTHFEGSPEEIHLGGRAFVVAAATVAVAPTAASGLVDIALGELELIDNITT